MTHLHPSAADAIDFFSSTEGWPVNPRPALTGAQLFITPLTPQAPSPGPAGNQLYDSIVFFPARSPALFRMEGAQRNPGPICSLRKVYVID